MAMKVHVLVHRDDVLIADLAVSRRSLTVGRTPGNDVVLNHKQVSLCHARVSVVGRRLVIEDCSLNGTFVDGERITRRSLDYEAPVVISPYTLSFSLEPEDVEGQDHVGAGARRDTRRKAKSAGQRRATPAGGGLRLSITSDPDGSTGVVGTFVRPGPVTIGRSPDNLVVLENRGVSRQHAVIRWSHEGGWGIEDLGSANGVSVNGQRVSRWYGLTDGDRVTIGPHVELAVEVGVRLSSAPPPVASPTVRSGGVRVSAAVDRRDPATHITIVRVEGFLNAYSYTDLRDVLRTALDSGACRFIVDLSNCAYCDHAGLGVLVSAQAALAGRKGAGFRLAGVSASLRDAFRLMRLDTVLAIDRTVEDAYLRLAGKNTDTSV
jgi:anti-anti-sigma factor